MTMMAKSGKPLSGHKQVNSGQVKRTTADVFGAATVSSFAPFGLFGSFAPPRGDPWGGEPAAEILLSSFAIFARKYSRDSFKTMGGMIMQFGNRDQAPKRPSGARRSLEMCRLILVISGGVAAVKAYQLARLLRDEGAELEVVVTESATNFVTPQAFAALLGKPAHRRTFADEHMLHLDLARNADMLLVAPATASFIAKMASGQGDDLATTVLLAATGKPVFLAPSMNVRMWNNPLLRENLAKLGAHAHLLEPAAGRLACGEEGMGRMAEPEEILAGLARFRRSSMPLSGKSALVTAGPTREPIDDVRFIASPSSGLQGYEVAKALCRLGATTTLVSGRTALPPPRVDEFIGVITATEMHEACLRRLPKDIFVSVAAVGDWRVANRCHGKLSSKNPPPALKLEKNPDILQAVAMAKNRRPQLVVGFAAECGSERQIIVAAEQKLEAKGCDWVVANDVSPDGDGGFESERNRVWLLDGDSCEKWQPAVKSAVAAALAAKIAAHFTAHGDA